MYIRAEKLLQYESCMAAMAALISRKVWFVFIAVTVVVVIGSPATELESVDFFLRDCERYFANADRKMAENVIVRLQVTIDLVRELFDSLGRGEAGSERENSGS